MNNDLDTFKSVLGALAPYVRDTADALAATEAVLSATKPAYTTDAYGNRKYKHDDLVRIALSTPAVMAEVYAGKKINAIKALREVAICGLKAGKEAVEDYRVWRA